MPVVTVSLTRPTSVYATRPTSVCTGRATSVCAARVSELYSVIDRIPDLVTFNERDWKLGAVKAREYLNDDIPFFWEDS
jgi:hypothetical protein